MSLEDEISDVIGKALRGHGMDADGLSKASGVVLEAVRDVLNGGFDEESVRRIADVLHLDSKALVGIRDYLPVQREIEGLRRIVMPFRNWTVNAWLVEMGGETLLFDTGCGERDILAEIDVSRISCVFITHGHVDHVGGIAALEERGLRVVRETEALEAGEFRFGEFGIRVVDLSGHCSPAVGYVVSGFEREFLVAGDAIFAGSAGGCIGFEAYKKAFGNMKDVFGDLDDSCLILPGHGPLTSLGEEKVSNPFRLEFS